MTSSGPERHRQSGAAALGVTLMLLFILTILGVLGTRVLVQDTRSTANELQAARAFEAAEAGLEYGVAWLNANAAPYTYVSDTAAFGTVAACPAASACQRISTDQTVTLGGFNVTIRFRRATVPLSAMNYMEVIAYAVATADTSNKATSRQQVFVSPFNSNKTGNTAPPLVVNGCISGVTGNPSLTPKAAGQTGILSSQAASCLDSGHMNLNGAAKTGSGFTGTAWDYVFPGMPKADMKAIADAQAAAGLALADRSVIWVTSSTPWHDSVGSLGPPVKPVVLVFAASSGCPKMNGNPVIVGIVYYEGGCDSNGFGGTDLHGSLVYEGSLTKFTANTTLNYNSGVATVVTTGSNLGGKVPKVAGTWKDF
jgi:Tfp pilus assembly protein PilX